MVGQGPPYKIYLNCIVKRIAARLLAWYDQYGRKDLPWQQSRTPYRVWLSEIMLQQTQVITAIPYFDRFVSALPTLAALAEATEDRVLALWSGLGYYSRARNLHRAAAACVEQHNGELPRDYDQLIALPGIGRSTAGAILAQAYAIPMPILDGNVKRVLTRVHGVRGWPGAVPVQERLWALAKSHTPLQRVADYTQAIMDLGATLCTRAKPRCMDCPLQSDCVAARDGLTAALPERKPVRAKPTRHTAFLILRDAKGRILLERRPPTGVWARLWSLPEANDEVAALLVPDTQGLVTGRTEALPAFVHSFSHYHLAISPILIEIEKAPLRVAEGCDQRWCAQQELAALGLPAPVRKLLNAIGEKH